MKKLLSTIFYIPFWTLANISLLFTLLFTFIVPIVDTIIFIYAFFKWGVLEAIIRSIILCIIADLVLLLAKFVFVALALPYTSIRKSSLIQFKFDLIQD